MSDEVLKPSRKVAVRLVGPRLRRIVEDNGNNWNTVQGIAHAANLPTSSVEYYIVTHPELFKVSPIRVGGINLYALNQSSDKKAARPYIVKRPQTTTSGTGT